MFGLSIILALIQAVGTLFLPKTPRFLLMSDKNELAFKTLQKIRGHGIDVESEFNEMKSAILEEQGYHWFVVNYPIQPYTKIDIKNVSFNLHFTSCLLICRTSKLLKSTTNGEFEIKKPHL